MFLKLYFTKIIPLTDSTFNRFVSLSPLNILITRIRIIPGKANTNSQIFNNSEKHSLVLEKKSNYL